jgi:hypothetical protein
MRGIEEGGGLRVEGGKTRTKDKRSFNEDGSIRRGGSLNPARSVPSEE